MCLLINFLWRAIQHLPWKQRLPWQDCFLVESRRNERLSPPFCLSWRKEGGKKGEERKIIIISRQVLTSAEWFLRNEWASRAGAEERAARIRAAVLCTALCFQSISPATPHTPRLCSSLPRACSQRDRRGWSHNKFALPQPFCKIFYGVDFYFVSAWKLFSSNAHGCYKGMKSMNQINLKRIGFQTSPKWSLNWCVSSALFIKVAFLMSSRYCNLQSTGQTTAFVYPYHSFLAKVQGFIKEINHLGTA